MVHSHHFDSNLQFQWELDVSSMSARSWKKTRIHVLCEIRNLAEWKIQLRITHLKVDATIRIQNDGP